MADLAVFSRRLRNSGNQPPAFVRNKQETKTLVPALQQQAMEASVAKSEENPSPLTILQKPTTKYSRPDFIMTIMFMHDKLYAVSNKNKYTEEPPQGDEFNAVWKAELKKESWFTNQNVSNILIGLRVSRGEQCILLVNFTRS